jgi:ABC-2 type transport system ATP-binding protein
VAFTLAVAKRPRLLLLDEPLANLDPLARTDFMRELMGTVAANGTTVVLSSHAISDLVGTCDWLVVLNRGQVQVSGDIDELLGAHHALSGPAADRLPDTVAVITRTESGRQAHHLVRGTAPVADPRWTSRPVGLEELVLGYLREPDAAALPGPALTTIEGGG